MVDSEKFPDESYPGDPYAPGAEMRRFRETISKAAIYEADGVHRIANRLGFICFILGCIALSLGTIVAHLIR